MSTTTPACPAMPPTPSTTFCVVCMDDVPTTSMETLDQCRHSLCRPCLTAHATTAIQEGLLPLTCVHTGCDVRVPDSVLASILSGTQFERYIKLVAIRANPRLRECPRCGLLQEGDPKLLPTIICGRSACSVVRPVSAAAVLEVPSMSPTSYARLRSRGSTTPALDPSLCLSPPLLMPHDAASPSLPPASSSSSSAVSSAILSATSGSSSSSSSSSSMAPPASSPSSLPRPMVSTMLTAPPSPNLSSVSPASSCSSATSSAPLLATNSFSSPPASSPSSSSFSSPSSSSPSLSPSSAPSSPSSPSSSSSSSSVLSSTAMQLPPLTAQSPTFHMPNAGYGAAGPRGTPPLVLSASSVAIGSPHSHMSSVVFDDRQGSAVAFLSPFNEGCGYAFCVEHSAAHPGMTCAAYMARQSQDPDIQASLAVLESTTKPCPHCGAGIEHAGGCDHVRCPACHLDFCWRCGSTQLTGKYTRSCSRCGQVYLDHQYFAMWCCLLVVFSPFVLLLSGVWVALSPFLLFFTEFGRYQRQRLSTTLWLIFYPVAVCLLLGRCLSEDPLIEPPSSENDEGEAEFGGASAPKSFPGTKDAASLDDSVSVEAV